MNVNEFATQYYSQLDKQTAPEKRLRQAIEDNEITPDMSLRKMGEVVGIDHPNKIRHYLRKFLKEQS